VLRAVCEKGTRAAETRTHLDRAIRKAPEVASLWFYLCRVERILGRAPQAMRCFREVLQLSPKHAEAGGELRILELLQLEPGKAAPRR